MYVPLCRKGENTMQKNMQQGRVGGPNLYQDGTIYNGW